MTAATREVLLKIEASKPVTKDDVLRKIIAYETPPMLLNTLILNQFGRPREFIAGFIGDRGSGKSAGCATTAVVDMMIQGKKVFSNMQVSIEFIINDETAMQYGLNSGGKVAYKSEPLAKDEFLNLEDYEGKYYGGGFVIEEINVQFSNVRKFMTNTNVDFNEKIQQFRKLETPLAYNVIDEMFIDPQLRTMTDMFIRTYDTAFDIDNMLKGKKTGELFHWTLYPISAYIAGEQNKYKYTMKPIKGYFDFKRWQGIYNSMLGQTKGIYSKTTKEKNMEYMSKISNAEAANPELTAELNASAYIRDIAIDLRNKHITEIEPWQLATKLGISPNKIKDDLMPWGIHYDTRKQKYVIEDFILETQTES